MHPRASGVASKVASAECIRQHHCRDKLVGSGFFHERTPTLFGRDDNRAGAIRRFRCRWRVARDNAEQSLVVGYVGALDLGIHADPFGGVGSRPENRALNSADRRLVCVRFAAHAKGTIEKINFFQSREVPARSGGLMFGRQSPPGSRRRAGGLRGERVCRLRCRVHLAVNIESRRASQRRSSCVCGKDRVSAHQITSYHGLTILNPG
jgi:hypothetical protein